MSGYRSYTPAEIDAALARGEEVWALDTGRDGEDDHLIGTYEECLGDIIYHFDLVDWPDGWTLDRLN